MYHLVALIKDLGKKCFGINEMEEDTELIEKIQGNRKNVKKYLQ